MKLETAKLVNHYIDFDAETALRTYIEDRINELHKYLENCPVIHVENAQGKIEELRSLMRIKEYAHNVLKAKK